MGMVGGGGGGGGQGDIHFHFHFRDPGGPLKINCKTFPEKSFWKKPYPNLDVNLLQP